MTRPEILVMGPYPQWDMEPLEADYRVHRYWEAADRDALVAAIAPHVRAIATRGELGASADLINRLPNLEVICCYGVGTDAIALGRARERGVRVTNTPEVLTNDVADMALALTLAVMRRIPQGDAYVRSRRWLQGNMELTTSLTAKTVGILGFGRIGRAVARRATAFEATVVYSDVAERANVGHQYLPSAEHLAAVSDVLIVCVAGGPATQNIVNAKVLHALGRDGYIINVSRGSTVDEEALIAALATGRIAGAGLDVYAKEPDIDDRLLGFDNVVVQPHHSSGTVETRREMGRLVRDNLAAHFAGLPLLTPVVGD